MCITCGCGSAQPKITAGKSRMRGHEHAGAPVRVYDPLDVPKRVYRPIHDMGHTDAHLHGQVQGHDHAHPHLQADGHLQVPGAGQEQGRTGARLIRLERDVLAKNDAQAMQNRKAFAAAGVLALNLVSSPGSGKTTLLVRTIEALGATFPVAVIEGDQQTDHDAERIRATGAPAVQINTGKGCHLDADMVARALPALPLADGTLLFIENVGNLVCPAAFDLGEACKVAVLSVTEGEDKPLKYPDMFRAARLMLLNKCDLLPYLDFDVERAVEYARRVNPAIEVIRVSAKSGEGMEAWFSWLARARTARQEADHV